MVKKSKFPPDWTDPSAYPDPEKTDGGQWAWEFIRRNPEYQEDYKILQGVKKKDSENVQTPYGYGLCVYNPRPVLGESSAQYVDRMKESAQHYRIAQLEEFLMEKWRFWGKLVDPQESDYSNVRVLYKTGVREIGMGDEFIDHTGNRCTPEEPNELGDYFEKRNEVMLKFDLEESIPILIKDTKSLLEMLQEEKKIVPDTSRSRSDLYQPYLQLLDAINADASEKEIASAIFPEIENEYPDYRAKQLIKDRLEAAKKLCQSGFRSLLK